MIPEDALEIATIQVTSWRDAYRGIVSQNFLDSLDLQEKKENWERRTLENTPPILRLVVENETQNESRTQDKKVIGFACGREQRLTNPIPTSDCELYALYVHPSEKRRGAGKRLLDEFKSEMKKEGKSRLCIWVLKENHPARRFYESQGGILNHTEKTVEFGDMHLPEVAYEFGL